MRLRIVFIVFMVILVSFLFVGCTFIEGLQDELGSVTDDLTDLDPNITRISEDINTPTVWTDEKVYVIENYISISSSIEIKPGTVVKFKPDYKISISGTIKAIGTEASPIIFTSYKDDSHGGDTNKDGNLTVPSKGDWKYLDINSNGNNFDYCEFYYGGGENDYVMQVVNSNASITNSVIANNTNGINAGVGGNGDTVIRNNIFYNNKKPLVISTLISIDDSNIFHKLDTDSIKNDMNGIFIDVNSNSIETNIFWEETEVPFVIEEWLGVVSGNSLSLADNVIIKFGNNGAISSAGTINADATNSIVFTSLKDDFHGGDTNGDGNITSPNPKDWKYIEITSDNGSIFNKCEFYYSGNYNNYALKIDDVTVTIRNSIFAHNYNGLNVANNLADPIITDNVFFDNNIPLIIGITYDLDDSNVFENPDDSSIKNTYQAIFVDTNSDTMLENVTWLENEVAYVINESLYIEGSLTLGPKVVLKFNVNDKISYNGDDLISINDTSNPDVNYFTSYKDDSKLGDSNADGNTTSPSENDWKGIWNDSSSGSYETWNNILYSENP